ncbi:MAG TPA: lactate 2-monooxygenase [Saprospiraceae bacterium]|nr:lactate 2-monooxygenase [Saprospiraceae bacterium]HMQ85571.1 lactate 2-monooxygenase [Saprospiraceae bacterium]
MYFQPMSIPSFKALERQRTIYTRGMSGEVPAIPASYELLEKRVSQLISPKAFAYIAGGAGAEQTIKNNASGFDRWQIVPRMLKDVSQCDTSLFLLGQPLSAPVLLSPIGVLELAHRQADKAVAKAAANLGIPMIFSNQASVPMEDCAALMGQAPRWFQLYWSKSYDLVASLVQRAEACGCSAIVVTLDTTMLGWRARDIDEAYLPFLMGMGIAQYSSDPVFQKLLDDPPTSSEVAVKPKITLKTLSNLVALMRRYPGSFGANLSSGRPLKAVRQFINLYTNPALNWEDLPFLRQHTSLPILLKGILHPDDARRAVQAGIDGIIVSNHGGRQVDGAIASIDALPGIVDAVSGQIPVLMDSGIRSGAHIFKALALGAKAVCIGRPYVYGLALKGESGVSAVLQNMLADFELTMRLSGCTHLSEINRDMLTKN